MLLRRGLQSSDSRALAWAEQFWLHHRPLLLQLKTRIHILHKMRLRRLTTAHLQISLPHRSRHRHPSLRSRLNHRLRRPHSRLQLIHLRAVLPRQDQTPPLHLLAQWAHPLLSRGRLAALLSHVAELRIHNNVQLLLFALQLFPLPRDWI